jgi:hypothetical protein
LRATAERAIVSRTEAMAFRVVDLVSQRAAVRDHVKGWSKVAIVEWLATQGTLRTQIISAREHFFFESTAGIQATFFFDGDELVFVGDHTTFM